MLKLAQCRLMLVAYSGRCLSPWRDQHFDARRITLDQVLEPFHNDLVELDPVCNHVFDADEFPYSPVSRDLKDSLSRLTCDEVLDNFSEIFGGISE